MYCNTKREFWWYRRTLYNFYLLSLIAATCPIDLVVISTTRHPDSQTYCKYHVLEVFRLEAAGSGSASMAVLDLLDDIA